MNFPDNAYLKLSQKFPDLLEAIIGFSDLTEELAQDDASLEVGVFQLSLAGQPYFMPVISKNDVIQPLDSVVSASTNLFFPALPAYLRSLINTPLNGFGKNMKAPNSAVANPNLYNLVVPPRTGKYIYASSSQAVELLSLAPPLYKKAFANELMANEEFAQQLHKMLDLEALQEALKVVNDVQTAPPPPITIVTEGTKDLSEDEIQKILEFGYAIRGELPTSRIATPVESFNDFGLYEKIPAASLQATAREVVMEDGTSKLAVFFKNSPLSNKAVSPKLFSSEIPAIRPVLFTDGTYTDTDYIVAKGGPMSLLSAAASLLECAPTSKAQDIAPCDYVVILSTGGEIIYSGAIYSRTTTAAGTFLKGENGSNLHVLSGISEARRLEGGGVLVPASYHAVYFQPLFDTHVCTSADAAQELNQRQYFAMFQEVKVLRAPNQENYIYDGLPISNKPALIQKMVIDEGIEPSMAETLIKTAEESGKCAFYLTKQADNFGNLATSQTAFPQADTSNAFPDGQTGGMGNVRNAASLQDSELLNAAIISELLQAPSLKQYSESYLPSIRLSIDRLGRLLFITRLKISDLFTGENGSDLIATMNTMKSVYSTLGALYTSLLNLPDDSYSEESTGK